jgi:putative membrane protein
VTQAATSLLVAASVWLADGWWIFGGLGVAAFWIAVIALIVVLLRAGAARPGGTGRGSALEVLEQRYARGEIDRDEFVERRAVLTGAGTEPQT